MTGLKSKRGRSHAPIVILTISIIVTSSVLFTALVTRGPPILCGWTHIYFSAVDIQQTSDDGYIILARREIVTTASISGRLEYVSSRIGSVLGGGPILLVKTDQHGNVQWNKTYGGDSEYYAQSVQQTSDRGFIVSASLKVAYSSNGQPGFYKDVISLIKMDESGDVQWNRTYGGIVWEASNSVEQRPDGGYIIAATTASYSTGGSDFLLVKTDAEGNMEWNKTYGRSGVDTLTSFQSTPDGGYLIAGRTYSDIQNMQDLAFLLIRTDQNGTMQWNATFALSHSKKLEIAQETSDGTYVMAGNMGTSVLSGTNTPIDWVFWLIKCDGNLNMLWNKTYGVGQEEWLSYILQTADGGFILAGNRWSNSADESGGWIAKVDQSGFSQWNRTYGDIGLYLDLMGKTSDVGYIIAGHAPDGVWLVKIDSLGSIDWTNMVQFPSIL
jgi:hypothetical protein